MSEAHVMTALIGKRAELAGTLRQFVQQRENLPHFDATLRLFDTSGRQ